MTAHLLDHFVFTSRLLTERTKWIVFGIVGGAVFGTFWWFKDIAFGITGPIADYKGLAWRKVS
jgi:dolichyl-phosphate-mannose-protein mannosyltransferase